LVATCLVGDFGVPPFTESTHPSKHHNDLDVWR